MSRIKKQGLDYLPLDVNLLFDRRMGRVMFVEGAMAPMVYITVLTHVYGEQGYFLPVTDNLYCDIARELNHHDVECVRRIILSCVEAELFDPEMFRDKHVLTSVDIQRQYLHVMRRRKSVALDVEYRLVDEDEEEKETPATGRRRTRKASPKTEKAAEKTPATSATERVQTTGFPTSQTVGNETDTSNGGHHVTNCPYSIAQQSIAQQSTSQQSIEKNSTSYPQPPVVPPQERACEGGMSDGMDICEEERGMDEGGGYSWKEEVGEVRARVCGGGVRNAGSLAGQLLGPGVRSQAGGYAGSGGLARGMASVMGGAMLPDASDPERRRAYVQQAALEGRLLTGLTHTDITSLEPPDDGEVHNLEALCLDLDVLRVTPDEQYRLILGSRFGVPGSKVFRGIAYIRAHRKEIHKPGAFLLKCYNDGG